MHTNHPVTDYASIVTGDTQFIDVREPDEVAGGTLPGTVNIPLGSLPDRLGELDSSKPVVVMCKSGGRSTQAAEFLTSSGFGQVTNLDGGWMGWVENS